LSALVISVKGLCQEPGEKNIIFRGIIRDAGSFTPISDAQIMINGEFSAVSENDGTFDFYASGEDTVLFSILGYKPETIYVSDTLTGKEYIIGVYLNMDTLSAAQVVIVPRLRNLKSEIMNGPVKTPAQFENARYNVAISAYQGRNSQGNLGDPADNYALLASKQKTEAYERGGIPSDRIAGLSPLMLIPAAYLLFKGLPPKPAPLKMPLSAHEIDQLHRKYLESVQKR
jgi:hypothetical protein